jgi:cytoplasmic iron level regulating protein YaaA (DUF328/UPF0246 family)
MGTKLPYWRTEKISAILKVTITKALNKDLENEELFVNLASNIFSAVDTG